MVDSGSRLTRAETQLTNHILEFFKIDSSCSHFSLCLSFIILKLFECNCCRAEHGFASLFWSVFGLTDLSSFETQSKVFGITSKTGQALFGLFQLITVIVAVNMLIAMMTRSFESIAVSLKILFR